MENSGVTCNVVECAYNVGNNKCKLATIEVTHEKTSPDAMSTPHFCKSYQMK
ncbi:MAG: DUF1540 domain-containing protein [Eubacteriales bacterium]|nr:DUF1540 domain-containing protein [Eubacteriales bacterium]MCI7571229.1 DUF1540 domain-containing protein [Clostridiales bacterium]MDD7551081.1 DUF1540 domain-containing protein [Clostridia bacterium]MDY5754350.1 DUF1540 domain-containing protein [Eubacteriales bacterium]